MDPNNRVPRGQMVLLQELGELVRFGAVLDSSSFGSVYRTGTNVSRRQTSWDNNTCHASCRRSYLLPSDLPMDHHALQLNSHDVREWEPPNETLAFVYGGLLEPKGDTTVH